MLVDVQAYLGAEKPETLATEIFEVAREPQYAVVVQNREHGYMRIWDVYRSEALATEQVNRLTNAIQFGILCLVRYHVLEGSFEDHPDLPGYCTSEDPELVSEVAE